MKNRKEQEAKILKQTKKKDYYDKKTFLKYKTVSVSEVQGEMQGKAQSKAQSKVQRRARRRKSKKAQAAAPTFTTENENKCKKAHTCLIKL